MQTSEPFVPFILAQRAFTETVIGLSAAMFEGIHKLVELNMQVARDTMTEVSQAPEVVHAVANPQELVTLHLSLLQSRAQMVASYGRGLQDIASSAAAEVNEVMRTGTAQVQSTFLAGDEGSSDNAAGGIRNSKRQDRSGAPSAHNPSNGSKKSASQADADSDDDPETTDTNGGRSHNGSAKSGQPSGGASTSRRSHGA